MLKIRTLFYSVLLAAACQAYSTRPDQDRLAELERKEKEFVHQPNQEVVRSEVICQVGKECSGLIKKYEINQPSDEFNSAETEPKETEVLLTNPGDYLPVGLSVEPNTKYILRTITKEVRAANCTANPDPRLTPELPKALLPCDVVTNTENHQTPFPDAEGLPIAAGECDPSVLPTGSETTPDVLPPEEEKEDCEPEVEEVPVDDCTDSKIPDDAVYVSLGEPCPETHREYRCPAPAPTLAEGTGVIKPANEPYPFNHPPSGGDKGMDQTRTRTNPNQGTSSTENTPALNPLSESPYSGKQPDGNTSSGNQPGGRPSSEAQTNESLNMPENPCPGTVLPQGTQIVDAAKPCPPGYTEYQCPAPTGLSTEETKPGPVVQPDQPSYGGNQPENQDIVPPKSKPLIDYAVVDSDVECPQGYVVDAKYTNVKVTAGELGKTYPPNTLTQVLDCGNFKVKESGSGLICTKVPLLGEPSSRTTVQEHQDFICQDNYTSVQHGPNESSCEPNVIQGSLNAPVKLFKHQTLVCLTGSHVAKLGSDSVCQSNEVDGTDGSVKVVSPQQTMTCHQGYTPENVPGGMQCIQDPITEDGRDFEIHAIRKKDALKCPEQFASVDIESGSIFAGKQCGGPANVIDGTANLGPHLLRPIDTLNCPAGTYLVKGNPDLLGVISANCPSKTVVVGIPDKTYPISEAIDFQCDTNTLLKTIDSKQFCQTITPPKEYLVVEDDEECPGDFDLVANYLAQQTDKTPVHGKPEIPVEVDEETQEFICPEGYTSIEGQEIQDYFQSQSKP